VDAMAIEPFSINQTDEDDLNSSFIFQVQPLDPDIPCFAVHFCPHSSGSSGSKIRQKLYKIENLLNFEDITIVAKSSDGDPSYSIYHKMMFNSYSDNIKISNISFLASICKRENLFISDFLHILK
jgi:hypothetical protein